MESTVQNTPPVRPMNEPHTPISEAESNPAPSSSSSSRNTLLTLASLLVLAGIVGITLWLYIQNKVTLKSDKSVPVKENTKESLSNETSIREVNGIKAVGVKNQDLIKKYGAICKKFTSIEQALSQKEVACILDLSSQNLTSIPDNLSELKNLTVLNLSNNHIRIFSKTLVESHSLRFLDLSQNIIDAVEDIKPNNQTPNSSMEKLDLTGNTLSNSDKQKLDKYFPKASIQY